MFYMSNKLGAWQLDGDECKGNVSFKLFFPKEVDLATGSIKDPEIRSIKVAGSFQHLIAGGRDWDFSGGLLLTRTVNPSGTFWSYETTEQLCAGFYEYKYLVEFNDGSTRVVSDPCTRYGGKEQQNAAFVIGGSRLAASVVSPLRSGRKPLRDLIMYEMHLDDFTDEYRGVRAPLDAAVDKLDYLVDLGFNAILFMPWTTWKNRDFDWGYEPFQYFAIEYRYANDLNQPAEKISWLRKLISACHERDIHVIMDGVFNHVSVDFPYKQLYRNPEVCPYTGTFGGTFPGLQDLDFDYRCTQDFIRDVCLYWIESFKIDGIRLDNTVNYNVPGETKGLTQLLQDIKDYLDIKGEKNFSLTLEHISIDAADLTRRSQATSYWDNALHEQCFRYLWHEQIDAQLLQALNNARYVSSSEKVPTSYLSNHDHSHVTWQAGARENMGSLRWYKTQPYIIALYTSPSVPMVPNGQEFGEDYWIPENDEGTGRRIAPRPLRWKHANDNIGQSLRKLYRRMAQIRSASPSLRTGTFAPDYWEEWQSQFNPDGLGIDRAKQVLIYRRSGRQNEKRHEFVIVLNFSHSGQQVRVCFPQDGEWTDLLSDYSGSWRPSISGGSLDVVVGAHWGHVFFKEL
jgi:1,4-alpha-glucan branching enzyme